MPTPQVTEVHLIEAEQAGLEQLVRRYNIGQQIALLGRSYWQQDKSKPIVRLRETLR